MSSLRDLTNLAPTEPNEECPPLPPPLSPLWCLPCSAAGVSGTAGGAHAAAMSGWVERSSTCSISAAIESSFFSRNSEQLYTTSPAK